MSFAPQDEDEAKAAAHDLARRLGVRFTDGRNHMWERVWTDLTDP